MKKALIKCLSDRRPAVAGLRLELGQQLEVSIEDAELLAKLGFAEVVNVDNRDDERTGRKASSKPKSRRSINAKGQPKTKG